MPAPTWSGHGTASRRDPPAHRPTRRGDRGAAQRATGSSAVTSAVESDSITSASKSLLGLGTSKVARTASGSSNSEVSIRQPRKRRGPGWSNSARVTNDVPSACSAASVVPRRSGGSGTARAAARAECGPCGCRADGGGRGQDRADTHQRDGPGSGRALRTPHPVSARGGGRAVRGLRPRGDPARHRRRPHAGAARGGRDRAERVRCAAVHARRSPGSSGRPRTGHRRTGPRR